MSYGRGDASTDLFNLNDVLQHSEFLGNLDGDEAERLGYRMGWLDALEDASAPLVAALEAAGITDASLLASLAEYHEARAALERGPLNG